MNTRSVRAAQVTGWTLVALAAVHIATEVAGLAGTPTAKLQTATTAMDQVAVPTSTHSYLVTSYGVSFAMALFLAAMGVAIVVAVRRGRTVPAVTRAMLWFAVAVTAIGLVLSIATLPLPPTIGLGIALVAAVIGLLPRRTRTA